MKKLFLDFVLVMLGNAILAFGYAVFAVPTNLIVGGATGLSLILSHISHIDYTLIVLIINMIMLILSYFILGKKFALGTILSSFAFPFFLNLFDSIPSLQHVSQDILLCTIYAGLFVGLGLGIVFRRGYSTGGMDIPPIIIHQKTGMSLAMIINVVDTIILVLQIFISNFEGILYGIITVFISNFVLDQVILLGEKNIQVFVISQHYEEIAEKIFEEVNRGCTFVDITTGYFHQDIKAVLCVVNTREYAKINNVVLNIDPTAFIISNEIHSVKGRGFTLPNIDLEKN